jgi:putative ABC transport system permease protein
MVNILLSALAQGVLYAPLALGIFIAFRILNTPDLTVDGSFVFGMVVCAVVTILGYPVLALMAGTLAGAMSGLITGTMQTKFKVNPILAGILTMTGLYSINYFVLGGRSNRYLQAQVINEKGNKVYEPSLTIYKSFASFTGIKNGDANTLILTLAIEAAVTVILALFFKTRFGLSIRATGDKEEMVRASSINADRTRITGLAMANALVGLSGALVCQQQTYADLNCGTGMLVMGLAAVIIGQIFFPRYGLTIGLISAVAGSILYRAVIALAYQVDMPSYMVKLISASIVALAMIMPVIKTKVASYRRVIKPRWCK